jgi:3-isopropylmalate dehydrogenase
VLTYVYDLWERAFNAMGEAEFSDIRRDYAHVDAITMWMVKNPEWFDVIVTGNMFGDIITDLGAMVQGGMGIAAGGNINPEGVSMFEPIGGSAPKYTGQNVINPLACVFAGAMLLDHLGEIDAADAVEKACSDFLASGVLPGLSAKDIQESGLSTSKIGDAIAENVANG